VADEDRHLADLSSPSRSSRQLHHHEQRVAVLLDLGPLVAVAGVLDRQRVQVELLLHLRAVPRRRHHAGPPRRSNPACRSQSLDVIDGNIGELGPSW
jgi:hypothetical protein